MADVISEACFLAINLDKFFIHLDVYLYPIPAPSWLVSSIGRALHRYRRGHGFKFRTGLNFFQVLFTTTSFSSVLSCEDLQIYKCCWRVDISVGEVIGNRFDRL